ncbi:MAG: lytic transglycosylase domain-containing protein [Oscillospiraceae bacterium]|jgi:soluble lytic murein transglycosylase-like protein|nr:lytic transglycosylase domain-containing protein [Oscillospiraceae bacterium]
MDGVGNIAAQRIYDALQRVESRMQEIESRTGLSFSMYLARSQGAQSLGGAAAVDAAGLDEPDETGDDPDIVETVPAEEASGTGEAAVNVVSTGSLFSRLPASEYDNLFLEVAARYGLNPSLIKALSFAESSFRPSAVSGAGAMGLMQLMPYTAEALDVRDPFDPEQNVDGGARLLSSLLDQFDGDALLALAAYNCGAYGVTSRGITDLSDGMQRALLPSETRGYIGNIEDYLSSAQALGVLDSPYAV